MSTGLTLPAIVFTMLSTVLVGQDTPPTSPAEPPAYQYDNSLDGPPSYHVQPLNDKHMRAFMDVRSIAPVAIQKTNHVKGMVKGTRIEITETLTAEDVRQEGDPALPPAYDKLQVTLHAPARAMQYCETLLTSIAVRCAVLSTYVRNEHWSDEHFEVETNIGIFPKLELGLNMGRYDPNTYGTRFTIQDTRRGEAIGPDIGINEVLALLPAACAVLIDDLARCSINSVEIRDQIKINSGTPKRVRYATFGYSIPAREPHLQTRRSAEARTFYTEISEALEQEFYAKAGLY